MRPRLRRAVPATLALAALGALAGCGGPDYTTPTAAPSGSAAQGGAQGGAALGVANSALGRIVVDGRQMTAYYYTKDAPDSGKSACAGPCLQAWPPITTTSETPAVSGVTGKVGTITLADGKKQVTVNGMPVYLFAQDSKPGDVLGQGVGGVWYVLGPDGTMIRGAVSSGGGY
jgi:predicted lipoprotein with Yx(FWY)xxD motif